MTEIRVYHDGALFQTFDQQEAQGMATGGPDDYDADVGPYDAAPGDGIAPGWHSVTVEVATVCGFTDASVTADFDLLPRLGALSGYQFETIPINSGTEMEINRATGDLLLSTQDLLKPEPGLDIDVDRYYNSADTATGQPGTGMRLSLGTDVRLTDCSVGWCFTGPGGYGVAFADRGDGTFAPPADLDATLTRDADGSITVTLLAAGLIYHFPADPAASAGTWTYAYSGSRLTTAVDPVLGATSYTYYPSGQLHTVSYGGQIWTIAYDTAGRVTSVVKTASGASDATWTVSYDDWTATFTIPLGTSTTYYHRTGGQVFVPLRASPRPTTSEVR